MYLTLNNPNALHFVGALSRGLWIIADNDEHTLVIKVGKEFILAARERRQLRLYFSPYSSGDARAATLLTACFDDPVSPLLIKTPLLNHDPLTEALKTLPKNFNACFFDEHNRELLSCRAECEVDTLRPHLDLITLAGPQHIPAMMSAADSWFAASSAEDDERSITIELAEDLFPSDVAITDFTRQGYIGSRGYAITHLERPEPGLLQELDIVLLLQRVYPADRIVHGPSKVSDGEELVDILVLGDEANLLFQAKDSPNTPATLGTKLDRKRTKALNQLKGGLGQLRGALSTIRRERELTLRVAGGEALDANLLGRPLLGVVVVRELFTDTYDQYGEMILTWMDENDAPAFAFDYNELEVMTRHCPSEKQLLAAFYQIFECARDRRVYPRLRFLEPPSC